MAESAFGDRKAGERFTDGHRSLHGSVWQQPKKPMKSESEVHAYHWLLEPGRHDCW